MISMRGNRNDYDEWERMGNRGWGYERCLDYFKKLENMRNLHMRGGMYYVQGLVKRLVVGGRGRRLREFASQPQEKSRNLGKFLMRGSIVFFMRILLQF